MLQIYYTEKENYLLEQTNVTRVYLSIRYSSSADFISHAESYSQVALVAETSKYNPHTLGPNSDSSP